MRNSGRLSTTLESPELLRGSSTEVLLGGFGRQLRGTSGGKAVADRDDCDGYANSKPVSRLDTFFSHSWHASWSQKYLVLVFHFNVTPAVSISILTGLMAASALFVGGPSQSGCERLENNVVITPVGLVCFVVVLFSWHHVASRVQCCSKSVFLDKTCIHQTDLQLKEQGIMAIGAFLANSHEILLAWDHTYFTRLWCTFELSAFRFAKPYGRIILVPVALGAYLATGFLFNAIKIALIYIHYTWLDEVFYRNIINVGKGFRNFHISLIDIIPWMCCLWMVRKYLRDCSNLDKQILSFAIQDAHCFCCTHDHLHPETKKNMLCDRRLVYNSIAAWYGNGSRSHGLDEFNRCIRTTIRRDMEKTLGRWVHVPYVHTLALGLPRFFMALEVRRTCPAWYVAVAAGEILLLRMPVLVPMTFHICRCFGGVRKPWYFERIVEFCLSIVLGLGCNKYLELSSDVLKIGISYYIAWLLIQASIVALLYIDCGATSLYQTSPRESSTSSLQLVGTSSLAVARPYDSPGAASRGSYEFCPRKTCDLTDV